jgi:hypothetical protein
MNRSLLGIAIFLSLLATGCGISEYVAEPTGFTIIDHENDSVYRNEPTWLKVGEVLPDVTRLKLFRRTASLKIDSVRGQYLYFNAPFTNEEGVYRLYKDDSVLATNMPSLGLLPQDYRSLNFAYVRSFGDQYGRVGDVISLESSYFPKRRGDIAVWVDGSLQKIIYQDQTSVQFRIDEGTRSGPIRLKLLDKDSVIGNYKLLGTGGQFLATHLIDSFAVQLLSMRYFWHTPMPAGGDTITEYKSHYFFIPPRNMKERLACITSLSGKSQFLSAKGTVPGDSAEFAMAYSVDAANHTISGTFGMRSKRFEDFAVRFQLKDAPWRLDENGNYIIFLSGLGMMEHFFGGRFGIMSNDLMGPGDLLPMNLSSMTITLVPRR